MKKINPFENSKEATLSLDNGGRFYNILTKADDGIITESEVGKVAGIYNNKQKVVLFLHLAVSKLVSERNYGVMNSLDSKLRRTYKKYKPITILPSEAYSKGVISGNTIVIGVPKLIEESKSEFVGFIMIPVSTGKTTTFVMVPLIDQYNVYEIRDEVSSETILIAHAKGSKKLPEEKIKVAGVLKELRAKKREKKPSRRYLEAYYYMDVEFSQNAITEPV
jgi:hypothetical protein